MWAGAGASEALVQFLIDSARNVGASPLGGSRIADHIGGVLAGRDPEPGLPFAAIGPGEAGTAVLLHGAIQAWDGTRWLIPQPRPGWLRTEVAGPATLIVTAHGAVSQRSAHRSDLRGGVVPAAGFTLVPEPNPAVTTAGLSARSWPGATTTVVVPSASWPGATTTSLPEPSIAPPAAAEATVVDSTELVDALRQIPAGRTDAATSSAAPPTLDLAPDGRSPLAPLPPVGQPDLPLSGQPVVAGVLCSAGHFNHPAVRSCVVCRRPVAPGTARVSGSRPPLGVLMVDDGSVYRLERSYLIGSAPDSDPTVTGGRARALTLGAAPAVAPAHAEIRLTGWGVSVIDRGSDNAVTQVLLPGATGWSALHPFVAQGLRPGAHIAVGRRTVSLISPWPIDEPVT